MKRTVAILALVLAVTVAAAGQRGGARGPAPSSEQNPPLAKTETEKRILSSLDDIVKAGELYANVPAADGRLLRVLTEAVNAKNVIEIGTSTGISGLWFCLALQKTGGKLTTFELDPGRAATARAHFKNAGVDRVVTLVEGDAHQNIARLKDPIDVVFIDAEKQGYVDYLNKLLPLVRPGGLILAHNVNMVQDYMKVVRTNPDLETLVYMEGGGLAVTLKKR
ncbi:MAG: class I SAM-dependent methyltransferase [Acidobacteria bacterium]|nr:class I SAM-dependent methyltransferase [Acidobacteriota bacterium]